MGISIWTFLWCLRRTTLEKNGLGLVLGGSPIKLERIARELGVSRRSVESDLTRLRKLSYIETKLAPYGLIITVLKSKRYAGTCQPEVRKNLPTSTERYEESYVAGTQDPANVIRENKKRKQLKRENSGSASPHRKNAPSKGGFEKSKEYVVDEVIYA